MKLKHVILGIALCTAIGAGSLAGAGAASATTSGNLKQSGLSNGQQQVLYAIAQQTWRFFDADADPNTHLPMDNIGFYGAPAQGAYTSPTNIGVYFWSVVAAQDLGLIDSNGALQRVTATLTEVEHLSKWQGFLFSWYDTTNGHRISGPGGTDQEGQPAKGAFISTVDSAWYATGLILVRQVFPELAARATTLLNAMNFGIFYDNGNQHQSNTAGQMYGGYYADEGPANFHYGLLNTETRIAAYIGIGTHQMPGDVWWRTWRTLPADFTWQGQTLYNIYDRYGFFDAVNPTTGQVGHRYLVLDQSMIMAALDDALRTNQMQQHFAQDPVIAAVQPYLAEESFSIP